MSSKVTAKPKSTQGKHDRVPNDSGRTMKGKEGGGGETKAGGWAWKTKTENAKKVEALREIEQLEQKINNLDREKGTHLYNKRSDFRKLFCTLEEQELKMNSPNCQF